MKKLLALALMLVMVISLASCSFLPEEVQAKIEEIKNSILGTEPDVHVHDFKVVDSKAATCLKGGYENLACDCGETQENVLEALGHDMQKIAESPANCAQYGNISYKCSLCGKKETETLKPTGHEWGELVENSRLIVCTKKGCTGTKMAPSTNKHTETLTFTFSDDDKAALADIHQQVMDAITSADKYDPALHAYVEEGEVRDAYEAIYALQEQYSDLLYHAKDQYMVIMTIYYTDIKNKDLEKTYNEMMNYYTELVATYYTLSQAWYDSMYREYYYYGATEEEINAFLFDSNAYANPEYTALKNRNDEIELAFNALENPMNSSEVPVLYAEFVENNKRIAEILGYESYLDFAYENVYSREYTPDEAAEFVKYVKEYMVPIYNRLFTKWNNKPSYGERDLEDYYSVFSYSFFDNLKANTLYNDFIDEMEMGFTSNPDKMISFSDVLNDMMVDGNLFRGTYTGAYVTYLSYAELPIVYFGKGNDNAFTIAHEFGHYMNEIYNNSNYNQSYDLLEMHSQGDEALFLYYIKDHLTTSAFDLVELNQLLNNLYIIVAAVQIDCFEQAIYRNSYDGVNSDIIMADGKITADEYDFLYASLSEELGIKEDFREDNYWRYGMTISSPCYYISYSISAINSLQIYPMCYDESFDAAKESYLKLISYTDENPDMTMEEIFDYAGFYSHNDKALYIALNKFLMSI